MKIARRILPFFLAVTLAAALLLQLQPSPAPFSTSACLAAENHQPQAGSHLSRFLEHEIARVQPLLDRYGYPVLFLTILIEGVGLVAPGQTLLIASALMAAHGGLSLVWVLILAFTAAFMGNTLGYLLGRRGGRPLLHKLRVNEKHLHKFEDYFNRYGLGIILIARFFDGLRQLNGIVAGLVSMPWKEFTLWNLLGAVLWTGFWGLGTYFLDKEIARVHLSFRQVEPWIAIMSLMGLGALLMYVLWPGRQAQT